MKKRNWDASVLSPARARADTREMIHYGMTKTAQNRIARGLAEIAGTGVSCQHLLGRPTLRKA